MIKCLFADISSIRSDISRTEFDESEIEYLADAILASDGLLRPLILKQTGSEQYIVIEGHLEYYAAVRAKEKDSLRAEMVNAFVIPNDRQQFAIEQLNLLSGTKSNTLLSATNISLSIEQLTSIIAQQLQPLQQQLSKVISELVEHKQILKLLDTSEIETEPKIDPVAKIIEPKPKSTTDKQPADKKIKSPKTPAKSKAAKSEQSESIDKPLEPKVVVEVATPIVTKSTTPKQAKSTSKPKLELDPSIDPIKAASTLDLINTMSEADLLFRMKKSTVAAGAIKLVSIIIDKRNNQPEQKFASWEIVMSEVPGLKSATAANIISKLK